MLQCVGGRADWQEIPLRVRTLLSGNVIGNILSE